MDATVSNISIKQTKMDETLAAKVADQEKLEAAIQDSIKKMDTVVQDNIGKMENAVQDSLKKMETTVQDSIKKTETSLVEIQEGKANKKEIAGEISGVESKLTLIQKELKTSLEKMNADIKAIEKKVSDDLAKHAETINGVTTAVAECQADLALISSEKEDKKAFEVAMKNQEKRLQDQTSQLIRNLEAKMESINASIGELGKIKSAGEKTALPPATKKP
jgi:chromosome segregation ATPase